MEKVKFLVGLQKEYNELEIKESDTLYFLIDTHRIYKGPLLFATGLLENLEQHEAVEICGGSAPTV